MTALALIPEESRALIARVLAHASQIGSVIEVAPLETPEAETRARELLRVVETLDGSAEAERKRLKAPYLEHGREIDDTFKPATSALRRVSDLIRRRLSEAVVRREAERSAALRVAAEAARAGEHAAANAAVIVADAVATVAANTIAAGVSDRMTWEAVAFEIRAMPIEFLAVDMPRIREAIRVADRAGAEPVIPGVTFRRAASVTVRKL